MFDKFDLSTANNEKAALN